MLKNSGSARFHEQRGTFPSIRGTVKFRVRVRICYLGTLPSTEAYIQLTEAHDDTKVMFDLPNSTRTLNCTRTRVRTRTTTPTPYSTPTSNSTLTLTL